MCHALAHPSPYFQSSDWCWTDLKWKAPSVGRQCLYAGPGLEPESPVSEVMLLTSTVKVPANVNDTFSLESILFDVTEHEKCLTWP